MQWSKAKFFQYQQRSGCWLCSIRSHSMYFLPENYHVLLLSSAYGQHSSLNRWVSASSAAARNLQLARCVFARDELPDTDVEFNGLPAESNILWNSSDMSLMSAILWNFKGSKISDLPFLYQVKLSLWVPTHARVQNDKRSSTKFEYHFCSEHT